MPADSWLDEGTGNFEVSTSYSTEHYSQYSTASYYSYILVNPNNIYISISILGKCQSDRTNIFPSLHACKRYFGSNCIRKTGFYFSYRKDLKTNSLSDWEFGTLSLPDTKLMYHSSQHGANDIF